jgi:hypothetical protein
MEHYGLRRCSWAQSSNSEDWFELSLSDSVKGFVYVYFNRPPDKIQLCFSCDHSSIRSHALQALDAVAAIRGKPPVSAETLSCRPALTLFPSPFHKYGLAIRNLETIDFLASFDPLMAIVQAINPTDDGLFAFLSRSDDVFDWQRSMGLYRYVYLACLAKRLGIARVDFERRAVLPVNTEIGKSSIVRSLGMNESDFKEVLAEVVWV